MIRLNQRSWELVFGTVVLGLCCAFWVQVMCMRLPKTTYIIFVLIGLLFSDGLVGAYSHLYHKPCFRLSVSFTTNNVESLLYSFWCY